AASREVWKARDGITVFDEANAPRRFAPDHMHVATLPSETARGIATEPGHSAADGVSRDFATKIGMPEDAVTWAAHVQLVPFWAARLRTDRFICVQAAARGVVLACWHAGAPVLMRGSALLDTRRGALPRRRRWAAPKGRATSTGRVNPQSG
ncbi:MAG: PhzF family phenazine biosynthesis protein, partial [Elioraea sp.]|nr:PhzF family phenazine biosynthesis protein [Elioraea sp.]